MIHIYLLRFQAPAGQLRVSLVYSPDDGLGEGKAPTGIIEDVSSKFFSIFYDCTDGTYSISDMRNCDLDFVRDFLLGYRKIEKTVA